MAGGRRPWRQSVWSPYETGDVGPGCTLFSAQRGTVDMLFLALKLSVKSCASRFELPVQFL